MIDPSLVKHLRARKCLARPIPAPLDFLLAKVMADHGQDDQLDDQSRICFALFWATYRSYLDTAEPLLRHDCNVTFVTTLQCWGAFSLYFVVSSLLSQSNLMDSTSYPYSNIDDRDFIFYGLKNCDKLIYPGSRQSQPADVKFMKSQIWSNKCFHCLQPFL